MENIAEILKDCPKGTKLYSPICGDCRLREIEITPYFTEIHCIVEENCDISFDEYGRFEFEYDGCECLLFPSKENRDWSTFNYTKRFKKGDFIHQRGWTCIYYGVNDYGAIQCFAFIPWDWNRNTSTVRYDVRPTEKPKVGIGYINKETRLATEDEKTLLLTAIEYYGFEWDAEKLELRKKEPEFKPFDKVLVRDDIGSIWRLAQYEFKDKNKDYMHSVVGGVYWRYCIPYEGNEHLLGTNENCG